MRRVILTAKQGQYVAVDGPAQIRRHRLRGKGRRVRYVVLAAAGVDVRLIRNGVDKQHSATT